MTSYNSLPFSKSVYQENKNHFETKIVNVYNADESTKIMSNYCEGYIFATYGFVNKIRSAVTGEDISLFSNEK